MIRFQRVVAAFLAVTGLVTCSAFAADKEKKAVPAEDQMSMPPGPSTAEENQAVMQQMMGAMMGQMVDSMARAMAKPEFATNMAAFTRNYYLALTKAGFSEEEAMKIVLSSGLPNIGSK